MKIRYFTKNISLSDEIKDYLEKKIQKLFRFSKKIQQAEVDLTYHQRQTKDKAIRLEINLRMPNKILRAVVRTLDLQTAIDGIENKLRKQLEKYKELNLLTRRQTANLIRKEKLFKK
jgi:ribosomal subunit interface protein